MPIVMILLVFLGAWGLRELNAPTPEQVAKEQACIANGGKMIDKPVWTSATVMYYGGLNTVRTCKKS